MHFLASEDLENLKLTYLYRWRGEKGVTTINKKTMYIIVARALNNSGNGGTTQPVSVVNARALMKLLMGTNNL